MKKHRIILIAAAVFAFIALSGCAKMSAEDLYALPQLSDEYLQLQERIDQVLVGGAELSAPSSGSNRQAVQLEDIDGDGLKEAIVFLSVAGTDEPLKIVIFRSINGAYEEAARLEGEGSGIDSINYTDMDGDGIKEIAVGWKIASGMNILSVYSMKDYSAAPLFDTDYTKYTVCKLDDSGRGNIVVLRVSTADSTGEAEFYALNADGEVSNSTARLSDGIEALRRVRVSKLYDNTPCLFVESTVNGSGLITDIFACRSGIFKNITMDDQLGYSGTVRSISVYCRDMDGDDKLDVPGLVLLPSLPESSQYYLVEWNTYRSSGKGVKVCTTYNNYSDYWYLKVPDDWKGSVTIRRKDGQSGERALVFSCISDGIENPQDFLTIYTLSGDNREERASYGSRFVLARDEEKIYAAEIISGSGSRITVNEEMVKSNFGILYSEWITGEM